MRKWLIYTLILLTLIPIIEGICCEKNKNCVIAETCQDAACGDCRITVYNRSGTVKIEQTDMAKTTEYLYTFNASTNLNNYGTYPYTINCSNDRICQGDCHVEVVQECEGENEEFYLYIVALIVFFILLGLGYYFEEGVFIMIDGMLVTIIGIVIFIYGFPNLTNIFLKNSISIVLWGVGAYLILAPAMEFFENWGSSE